MPEVECPIADCPYVTPDLDASIVAALLTTHATTHTVPGSTTAAAKTEKVKRPSISLAGSSQDWTYFECRWGEYANATKVTGREKVVQLLECCDEELRRDLTRSAGTSLTNRPEDEVLAAIKSLAVREENVMVSRISLNDMHQDRDESIRSFGARIRGQANICKYTTECHSCYQDVNYTEEILRDVLCRGIEDPDIQLSLLSNLNQNMTLEEMFRFVEIKQGGKRSASRISSSTAAGITQYKKKVNTTSKSDKWQCTYCGEKGHGEHAPGRQRRNVCPAYNHTCESCTRLHHFGKMCRSKHPKKSETEEGAIFQSLCSISNGMETVVSDRKKSIKLDHHLYDQLSATWVRKPSKPQPYINVNVEIHKEDYDRLGFVIPPRTTLAVNISALADTGCQSCLASINIISKLGINKHKLIPVTMEMHAANNGGINILGAAILRFSGKNHSGQTFESRQITYVTDNSEKLFLSNQTCIDLGIIPNNFPSIGETTNDSIADDNESPYADCGCLKRTLPKPAPKTLPFRATPENREKLQTFLLEHYRSSTFNTCDHQPLPLMDSPPLKLMIDPDAEPVAVHTPVPVPIHWREDVKAGIDRDVRLGVIEPVPVGEPVTWCHRMVVCAKKDGTPRRTVDFQPLNAHATRETHHTQSPFHQARSVPPATKKTVCDAWNGYHSVPLREEDRHLTTFITPWGRYRYCTTPQGYIASGDGYSRRYDEIVADVPNKTKCIDDVLLWSDDLESSFHQTCQWLNICGNHGIIQNPKKFVFGEDVVEFAGFEITPDSVRPSKTFLQAIQDFPTPKNISDIRSWFGLVNQASYSFSMTTHMLPFRELLKPQKKFHWDDELNKLFESSKNNIIREIESGVRIFNKAKPTCLATDWSQSGIGFTLFQKHCGCTDEKPFCCQTGWRTVLVGSRFTHAAESRYAPIEGEALAVAHALDKARYFVLGCANLIVAVDHKPLLRVFNNRSLNDIPNNRLRNLKEKTLRYSFKMVHIAGDRNFAPDSLSRHPTGAPNPEKMHLQDDIFHLDAINGSSEVQAITDALHCITWDRVRLATTSDNDMHQLSELIQTDLPYQRHELPPSLQAFHQYRDHLTTMDGVILYKDRVVIPKSLHSEVLSALHAAHQGTTSMIARAETSVFWPGITKDIISTRNNCQDCWRMAPSQPNAPPTPLTYPSYPFQCICADFFHYMGQYYLVSADRYTNWPIVERVNLGGASNLINCMRRIFVTYGIPDELSSDGGPEFKATATTNFLKNWGVNHRQSSTSFPHSNCRAEIAVKTVKRMITNNTGSNGELDTDRFQRAILQYRNAPDQQTKLSPAMLLFGRPIRDFIPIVPGKYKPHPTWTETLHSRELALRNRHMKDCERLLEHTKKLPPLVVGDSVRIQNQTGLHPKKWDKTGTIIEVRQFDQYVIRVHGSGRVTLRNRKFLRKYTPVFAPATPRIVPTIPPPMVHQHRKVVTPIPLETADGSPDVELAIPDVEPGRPSVTHLLPPPMEPQPEAATEPTLPSASSTSTPSSSRIPNSPHISSRQTHVRRSTRIRKQPEYLKDYDTK